MHMLVMVRLAATIFHDYAGRITGKARTDSNGVTTYYDAAERWSANHGWRANQAFMESAFYSASTRAFLPTDQLR